MPDPGDVLDGYRLDAVIGISQPPLYRRLDEYNIE
jgi:hypothetical protein